MLRTSRLVTLLALATVASAQVADEQRYGLSVNVQLVQLPVSVVDKHGLSVRGLQQEHFAVYEDKVLQNISFFKQEDSPLSIALAIDVSGSMLDKTDRLKAAVATFIRESNPDDETAIVTFGEDIVLAQDFTDKATDLSRAFSGIANNKGTALYDAIFVAASHLQDKGSYEKKALIIISDGEDNKSAYNIHQVLQGINDSKVTVFTVGLVGSAIWGNTYQEGTGKSVLKRMADVSGGAAYFPKKVGDVEDVCRKIARDLRSQYTLGYRPSNDRMDGSWRKVVVRLSPPQNISKLRLRTKQGYYAPSGKSGLVESAKGFRR